jgi:nitroreductase
VVLEKNLMPPAPAPQLGDPLPASRESAETIELMRLRRSTPADCLVEPGPDAQTLASILTIAARTPDHRRVTPFRFVTFEGDARTRFGDVLREAFIASEPDANKKKIAFEQRRFLRAPVVVAVISKVDRDHRTPEWEQILTAGAVCQNMLVAASAEGFAAQWITEWYAYDVRVLTALGLDKSERIVGYIYMGSARADPKERARPVMEQIVTRF